MLELESLSVSHDKGRTFAVEGVSFGVRAGEQVALIGASGCGKTTMLEAINRVVPLSSGRVLFEGRDTRELDPVALRRRVGYVIQQAGLFPHWSVARNVGVVPTLLGWDMGRVTARVRELLELVQLDPDRYADRAPHELSGGQRQRVGFARALAGEPPLVLLDEPFGALDPVTREELTAEFRAWQARMGFASLLVTHDMAEALLLADRVAVLRAGHIVQIGTPAELIAAPADAYVTELLSAPRRQTERLSALGLEPR